MTNTAREVYINEIPLKKENRVVEFTVINTQERKKTQKLTKDGKIKKSGGNKQKGKHSTVYPIKNPDELQLFINYFKNNIKDSGTEYKLKANLRNYLLITVGLNSAYRISDIISLKWGDFFDENMEYYKNGTRRQDQKTQKYRTTFINKEIKDAVEIYLQNIGDIDRESYIFTTCKSGSGHMTEQNAYDFIKKAAKEIGINIKLGTHSLRKTFVYHSLMNHKSDAMYLTKIQKLLGHSSPGMTLAYAGITDEENQQIFNDIGDFYKQVLKNEYQEARKNVISISKDKIIEIIKMAYSAGKTDYNVDYETDVDNLKCLEELVDEYVL